ncbi:hypothetical protein [Pedobacter mucosus]|uniref:hypothetical protein n=1 Tax=Pedobacter mucosus TaxID=2895286 RepID=UPI001EE4323D|nr:hypothetical protein [Pedobacter mucosus]UKT65008.1 hypothetical protein LOK61_04340 [Pedobacter mucosus]
MADYGECIYLSSAIQLDGKAIAAPPGIENWISPACQKYNLVHNRTVGCHNQSVGV